MIRGRIIPFNFSESDPCITQYISLPHIECFLTSYRPGRFWKDLLVYGCECLPYAPGGQKRPDLLQLELWTVVSHSVGDRNQTKFSVSTATFQPPKIFFSDGARGYGGGAHAQVCEKAWLQSAALK